MVRTTDRKRASVPYKRDRDQEWKDRRRFMRTDPGTEDDGDFSRDPESGRRTRTTMSLRTVAAMVVLIAAMTAGLLFYIKLQADVTSTSREIAGLEQKLTEMKAINDAAYNEINDRISLDEVRKRAIGELGMKYADKNQVVIYSASETDSVHQVSGVRGK